jgi:hypothetical protein
MGWWSKWNRIEPRLFSALSMIGATTTQTGLRVHSSTTLEAWR